MSEVCVPPPSLLCPKCGAPRVSDVVNGVGFYACVYCQPELFPRPKMSAAADTAELDRLRAENARMKKAIRESIRWLNREAEALGHVSATASVRYAADVMWAGAGKLFDAIKEYP